MEEVRADLGRRLFLPCSGMDFRHSPLASVAHEVGNDGLQKRLCKSPTSGIGGTATSEVRHSRPRERVKASGECRESMPQPIQNNVGAEDGAAQARSPGTKVRQGEMTTHPPCLTPDRPFRCHDRYTQCDRTADTFVHRAVSLVACSLAIAASAARLAWAAASICASAAAITFASTSRWASSRRRCISRSTQTRGRANQGRSPALINWSSVYPLSG